MVKKNRKCKPADELDRKLYGEDLISVYGPYVNRRGQRSPNSKPRLNVVLYYTESLTRPKRRVGMSYPKYVMERHLQRKLIEPETVDHFDENPLNNNISNLHILHRIENVRRSSLKRSLVQVCPQCQDEFNTDRPGRKYCSRKCNVESKRIRR